MHKLRSRLLAGLAMAALGLGAGAVLVAAATPAEIVKERQALMKKQGGHMKAIYEFTEGKSGETAADIAKRAEDLAQSANEIVALFPEGTGRYAATSAALPAIWEDFAGFTAAAQTLHDEALKLAEAANGGDPAKIAEAFGNTGKNGCGGCHSKFREKTQ